jgi:hypothetical protein
MIAGHLPMGANNRTVEVVSAPTWKVGQRVARPSSNEFGTVVEITRDQMKIKWDSGATSDYRHVEAHVMPTKPQPG